MRINSLQKVVLKGCFRRMFWKDILKKYFERMFWKNILRRRFEKIFWEDVLRGLGNNPLDLLYNSNEPSNVIRPRGLGGTPIKKIYPKRRKLPFYPPEISYLRPLHT
jgi:hypothetical protein